MNVHPGDNRWSIQRIVGGAFENTGVREAKNITIPFVGEGEQQIFHSREEQASFPSYNVSCLINPANQTVVNFDDRDIVYSVVFAITVDSSVVLVAGCYS